MDFTTWIIYSILIIYGALKVWIDGAIILIISILIIRCVIKHWKKKSLDEKESGTGSDSES